jgi:glutaredoxin
MAKKEKKKEQFKEINLKVEWLAVAILIILLAGSVLTNGFTNLPFNLKSPLKSSVLGGKAVSDDELKKKIADYIKQEYQSDAEVTEITEETNSNLYKVKIKISGQEFESYATKDGAYLYPERLEMIIKEVSTEYPKQDVPTVMLFTMSYCPYGNQAEDFVRPVYDLIGSKINIEPHYVIYNQSQGYEGADYCLDSENNYCSMHGIQELNQDVRELCTYKYQKDKYWDFVMAANEKCDSSNVDTCWEQVAKDTGIDVEQIKSCQTNEATNLLSEEVRLNQEYSVTGSPTILINGKEYAGARTSDDFKNAVCSGFTTQPDECSQTLNTSEDAATGSCN